MKNYILLVDLDEDLDIKMYTNQTKPSYHIDEEIDAVMFLYFVKMHEFSPHNDLNRIILCP